MDEEACEKKTEKEEILIGVFIIMYLLFSQLQLLLFYPTFFRLKKGQFGEDIYTNTELVLISYMYTLNIDLFF